MFNIISLNSQIGFELFDQTHLIWLLIVSLGLVLGCVVYIKQDIKQKKRTEYILSYTLLLLEVIKLVVVYMEGKSLLYYLPIHLCGLAIFLMLIYAHTNYRYIAEILYAVTLPGALIALITPGWANEELFSFLHIHSFLFHMVILLFPLMLVISRKHRPSLKLIFAPVSFLIVIVPTVYYFNKVTGTNYMFLNWPIKGTPIMSLADWFGEPGYIFGMVIVLLLVWLLLYSKETVTLFLRRNGRK